MCYGNKITPYQMHDVESHRIQDFWDGLIWCSLFLLALYIDPDLSCLLFVIIMTYLFYVWHYLNIFIRRVLIYLYCTLIETCCLLVSSDGTLMTECYNWHRVVWHHRFAVMILMVLFSTCRTFFMYLFAMRLAQSGRA